MNDSARMLMTIPVGKDGIYLPNHRVYGNIRLPQLLAGYNVVTERFFEKTESKRYWAETSKENAISTQSSASFYSIGLFILTKK
jgi:AMMECR1 domain-containing protein